MSVMVAHCPSLCASVEWLVIDNTDAELGGPNPGCTGLDQSLLMMYICAMLEQILFFVFHPFFSLLFGFWCGRWRH